MSRNFHLRICNSQATSERRNPEYQRCLRPPAARLLLLISPLQTATRQIKMLTENTEPRKGSRKIMALSFRCHKSMVGRKPGFCWQEALLSRHFCGVSTFSSRLLFRQTLCRSSPPTSTKRSVCSAATSQGEAAVLVATPSLTIERLFMIHLVVESSYDTLIFT